MGIAGTVVPVAESLRGSAAAARYRPASEVDTANGLRQMTNC